MTTIVNTTKDKHISTSCRISWHLNPCPDIDRVVYDLVVCAQNGLSIKHNSLTVI